MSAFLGALGGVMVGFSFGTIASAYGRNPLMTYRDADSRRLHWWEAKP